MNSNQGIGFDQNVNHNFNQNIQINPSNYYNNIQSDEIEQAKANQFTHKGLANNINQNSNNN